MEDEPKERGDREARDEGHPSQAESHVEKSRCPSRDKRPRRTRHDETQEEAPGPKGPAAVHGEDRDEGEEGRQRGTGQKRRTRGIEGAREDARRREEDDLARGQRRRRTPGRQPR